MSILEQATIVGETYNNKKYTYLRSWYNFELITDPAKESVSLAAGQNATVKFTIAAQYYFNLKRSMVAYKTTIPAAGGGFFNWHYEDVVTEIGEVEITDKTKATPVNVKNVQNLSKCYRKSQTKFIDFNSMDSTRGLYRGELQAENYRPQATGFTASEGFREPNYLLGEGDNTVLEYYRCYFLSDVCPDSLCAVDKTIRFPKSGQIQLTLGPASKIGFTSENENDPAETPSSTNYPIVISDIRLLLALEQNPAVIAQIDSAISSKDGLVIPYPYMGQTQESFDSTSWQDEIKITSDDGFTLQKIIYTIMTSPEENNLSYDNSNIDPATGNYGSKIVSYETKMNSNRLQPSLLLCGPNDPIPTDDYLYNFESNLKDSVISSNDIYSYNWCHIENFSRISKCADDLPVPDTNIVAGLSLAVDQLFRIKGTAPNNDEHNHYIWTVTQRELVIKENSTLF